MKITGSNSKRFEVRKGGRARWKVIKDVLNADGRISQRVEKRYTVLAEVSKEKDALRKVIVSALEQGFEQEEGDYLAELVTFDRSNFLIDKALAILTELGFDKSEFYETSECKKLAIR
jgi:hypothetical protein